jgi:hypothetical protein
MKNKSHNGNSSFKKSMGVRNTPYSLVEKYINKGNIFVSRKAVEFEIIEGVDYE